MTLRSNEPYGTKSNDPMRPLASSRTITLQRLICEPMDMVRLSVTGSLDEVLVVGTVIVKL